MGDFASWFGHRRLILDNVFPQTSPPLALGSEREELLKGLEILERTQQWFNGRLGQLALGKSTSQKVSNSKAD